MDTRSRNIGILVIALVAIFFLAPQLGIDFSVLQKPTGQLTWRGIEFTYQQNQADSANTSVNYYVDRIIIYTNASEAQGTGIATVTLKAKKLDFCNYPRVLMKSSAEILKGQGGSITLSGITINSGISTDRLYILDENGKAMTVSDNQGRTTSLSCPVNLEATSTAREGTGDTRTSLTIKDFFYDVDGDGIWYRDDTNVTRPAQENVVVRLKEGQPLTEKTWLGFRISTIVYTLILLVLLMVYYGLFEKGSKKGFFQK